MTPAPRSYSQLIGGAVLVTVLWLPAGCTGVASESGSDEEGDDTTSDGGRGGSGGSAGRGGSGGQGGRGGAGGTGGGTSACSSDPAWKPVSRLTGFEYDNTVADLLGDTSAPAQRFPKDIAAGGFRNVASAQGIDALLAERYVQSAATLASRAVAAGSPARAGLYVCTPASDATCTRQIVTTFLRRAWRRPATEAEVSGMMALVDLAKQNGDTVDKGIELVVRAALSSPHFVFRFELDAAPESDAIRPLTGFEMASRLSYFLWASGPDATLLDAAEKGQLATPAQLTAQAKRMLADAKAKRFVGRFASEWLGTIDLAPSPDKTAFPDFDPAVVASMQRQTEAFAADVLLGGGDVRRLFDADYTYLDARLAKHYGVPGTFGASVQKVPNVDARRRGVLTHGSVLTSTSTPTRTSVVRRGVWIMDSVLCAPPPPVPDGLDTSFDEESAEGLSMREKLERHRKDPACGGCHSQIDPLGFALENYDAIGRWRDREGTLPIDVKSELPDGTIINGAAELAGYLVEGGEVERCIGSKVMTYALGRVLDGDDDCEVDRLTTEWKKQGRSLEAFVTSLVTSDTFTKRRGPGATSP